MALPVVTRVIRLQAEQPDVANAGAYRFRPETRPSQAIESDDGLRFPLPVAVALAEGVHAVRAIPEYRQMTQDQHAHTSGLSKPFHSQIEGRVRVAVSGRR
jgi:hypothetical protein